MTRVDFFILASMVILLFSGLVFCISTMNFGSASWVNEPVNPIWRSTCDAWVRSDCRRTTWKWNQ